MLPIYMDNHATTRVDPRVLGVMLPYFSEHFGNAASRTHRFGHRAEEAVTLAREQIASLLNARPREIIFTSGATESDNLALKGAAFAYRQHGNHIITVATEHKAVLDPCRRLVGQGFDVTVLPVDRDGLITIERVASAIRPQTILVSVMAANNEIGVLQPVEAIGRLCKERGVLFHTDAAQAGGKVPLDAERLGVDLLSLSAHKMYGPKGVGVLYVRSREPRVRLEPLIDGGGHERGLRSGTLPVPLIVGFGQACVLAQTEMDAEATRLRQLRDRLYRGIRDQLDGVHLNGHPTERLPGNLNLSFDFAQGDAMLMQMQRDVALSSGSACTSAEPEPSHVLLALGIGEERAHNSIRFGLGRFNTEEEVDHVARAVAEAVKRLRAINPMAELSRREQIPDENPGAAV